MFCLATPAEVRAEVEAHLAASHARHPGNASLTYSITYQGFQAQGCVVDIGAPAIQQLLQAHRDIAGTDAPLNATPATTDVRFFHLYGQAANQAASNAAAASASAAEAAAARAAAAAEAASIPQAPNPADSGYDSASQAGRVVDLRP